jgi:hypothetical protein
MMALLGLILHYRTAAPQILPARWMVGAPIKKSLRGACSKAARSMSERQQIAILWFVGVLRSWSLSSAAVE